jgi:phosphonopyruvate decarboxylase
MGMGYEGDAPGPSGKEFVDLLEAQGYDFFAGVPCSLLEGVLQALGERPALPYLAAHREDAAVGLAAGAWLGGRRPAVLMQNSGLGTSLNALASLSLLYRLPCLLVVTWRGLGGADAPEHRLTGQITPPLLDLLGIPHRTLGAAPAADDLAWATAEIAAREQPVALLLPPGFLPLGHAPAPAAAPAPAPPAAPPAGPAAAPALSRFEALGAVVRRLGGAPAIHANGYICRESFALADRPLNFYMIGSMGLAPSIGLGLALARPGRRVVVLDGDGNLLMNLGALTMAGALQPANLVHLVFDNGVYGSTGDQPTLARRVRLEHLAAAAGYRWVRAAAAAGELEGAVAEALAAPGPAFLLLRVTPGRREVPRIPYTPVEIRDRFRAALGRP